MRDYGKVIPSFWTRGSGKSLRGDALGQVVALYLFTCPAATMTGLFYLGLPTMAHETGHSIDDVRDALRRVRDAGIAKYDEGDELVWLPEMARIQVGETLTQNDKRAKGIVREISHHRGHVFFDEFVARYFIPFGLSAHGVVSAQGPYRNPEGPSKGLPVGAGTHVRGIPQEQEHGQDHDQGQGARAQQEIPSESVFSRPNARAHEEQVPIQSTHTLEAISTVEQSDIPPPPDADWLASEFARFPAIARFSTDQNLTMDLAGGLQAKPHTREQSALIVADFVTKTGGEARTMDRAEFQRRFGGYVTSSRLRTRSSNPQSEPVTPDTREALALFAASWRASQGRERVPDTSDPEDAATCLALAKTAARGSDVRPMKIFTLAVEAYLSDAASWLKDAQWPLRLLAKKFSSYAKAPTPKPKPGPAKAPEELPMRTTRRGTIGSESSTGNVGAALALVMGDKS